MVVKEILYVVNGGEDLGARLSVADEDELHLKGREERGRGREKGGEKGREEGKEKRRERGREGSLRFVDALPMVQRN